MAKALRTSSVVIARGYTDAEIEAIKAEARRAMKERCAKVADEHTGYQSHKGECGAVIAAAIRALPDEKEDSA